MIRSLCLLLLALLAFQAGAATLTASVDRARLSEGETVELTLVSDDATAFGKPDLSPLEPLFEVLDTRQVNRLTTLDGTARASTQWLITLRPKQTGFVVIPPLRLGEAESQPLTVRVMPADTQGGQRQLAPVFIDASLDQESVYVQAQVVLTLRIYHSVSLYDDSSLTALQMPDARVEQLGDPRTYEKDINGVRHGVIELRYAIFPQRSGDLTIPSQTFSATLVERNTRNPYQPFGSRPGKLTRVKSPDIPLAVKPKPAEYPADAPWLPARALSLSESWNPEPGATVKAGDSLTRSLLLKVDGLSGAQLPPLPADEPDGLRRYPDQPQLASQAGERGIAGSREERVALVPTQAGDVAVPALNLVWWNTAEDRLEHARLPGRTLHVAGNPSLEPEAPLAAPLVEAPSARPLWPWQAATALLACTTLLGFGLWWRARRQPAILPTVQSGPSPRTLLDDLRRACQANDPQATRQALDAWARQQPETLAAMAARFAPLSESLDGLNGALYSEAGQHWQGEALFKAIRALPPAEAKGDGAAEASPLPPLYPR